MAAEAESRDRIYQYLADLHPPFHVLAGETYP